MLEDPFVRVIPGIGTCEVELARLEEIHDMSKRHDAVEVRGVAGGHAASSDA